MGCSNSKTIRTKSDGLAGACTPVGDDNQLQNDTHVVGVPENHSAQNDEPRATAKADSKAVPISTNISAGCVAPNSAEFRSVYKLGDVLGQGSFSVVRLGKRISDGQRVAVKIVSRKRLKREDELALRAEVGLLMKLKHPNIVRLFDFFEEREHFYVVLEYVSGGELFDRLIDKEFYSEGEARDLFTVLLYAVKYLHDKNIIHRDIKPENILLASDSTDTDIKLADFGFAVLVGTPNAKKQAGTPGYIAPEIIRGLPHGKAVDCWSLGVVLFMLLGGYPPFYDEGDDLQEIFRKIVNVEFEFHPENWDDVSDEAKDLVRGLLTLDPQRRLSVHAALQHPWMRRRREELALVSLDKNMTLMRTHRHAAHAAASFTAGIAVEAVRQLSGANLAKSINLNDVAIDVMRKLSGANLNDVVIEAARKRSGANLNLGGKANPAAVSPTPTSSGTGTGSASDTTPLAGTAKSNAPNADASPNGSQAASAHVGVIGGSNTSSTQSTGGTGIQVQRKKSGVSGLGLTNTSTRSGAQENRNLSKTGKGKHTK